MGRSRSFYSQVLSAEDHRRFLEASRDCTLDEEIALVRTRIRALAGSSGKAVAQQDALLLRAVGLLARLVRINSQLRPNEEDRLGELNEEILRQLEGEGQPPERVTSRASLAKSAALRVQSPSTGS